MTRVEELIELLSKPIWANKDIKTYTGCAESKAVQIHVTAVRKYNGLSRIFPKMVKRDAVFAALGIDLKEEVEHLKVLRAMERDLE